jgi:hypothetical protein
MVRSSLGAPWSIFEPLCLLEEGKGPEDLGGGTSEPFVVR